MSDLKMIHIESENPKEFKALWTWTLPKPIPNFEPIPYSRNRSKRTLKKLLKKKKFNPISISQICCATA
jgi:hypothetical protein